MAVDRDNPLLEAVEALTKPVETTALLDDGTTEKALNHPLLVQLEQAVRGSIVGIGGSGSLANERNMLNGDALLKAMKILSTLKDWARIVGVAYVRDVTPADLLSAWYVGFIGKPHEPDAERFYVRELDRWTREITAMFDPPRKQDLPNPCPICGATEWWDPSDGQKRTRPLVITFHEGPQMIDEGKGLCRACDTAFGLRELAYAIEEKEREEEALSG